jgi:hypothetical protein
MKTCIINMYLLCIHADEGGEGCRLTVTVIMSSGVVSAGDKTFLEFFRITSEEYSIHTIIGIPTMRGMSIVYTSKRTHIDTQHGE